MTALQLYAPHDIVGRTFRLNPFRGRLIDLVGGRSPLARFAPYETDASATRMVRRIRRTRTRLWPATGPEAFDDRVARVLRAFRNVQDLLG